MDTAVLAAKADDIMRRHFPTGAPGAALGLMAEGQWVLRRGYGLAELAGEKLVTTASLFRLASLTKAITAAGVLLLADSGALRLDEPIGSQGLALPGRAGAVSVAQLLTHTSGIHDYETRIPRGRSHPLADEDVLALLRGEKGTYFPPGTRFRYSNTGYCLLALLIARAAGSPYATFIRDHLFRPLGMSGSRVYTPDDALAWTGRAYGYHASGNSFIYADQNLTSSTQGDGGIYASLDDYLRWCCASVDATLLPWAAGLFLPHARVDERVEYGYGYFLGHAEDGGRCHFHSGESTGFRHIMYHHPGKGQLLVLLSNRDGDSAGRAFEALMRLTGATVDLGRKVPLFRWLHETYGEAG